MYIYRYDPVESLYSQRLLDRVLRARRYDGRFFPHFQLDDDFRVVPVGCADYRICFWKNFDYAKANPTFFKEDWALLRIKSDHAVLKSFMRGDDEYPKDKNGVFTAYIYWATMEVCEKRPDFSPCGIPHEDIEVLLPNGEWTAMDDVPLFKDPGADWICNEFTLSTGSICCTYFKVGKDMAGNDWLLIRQLSMICGNLANHAETLNILLDFARKIISKKHNVRIAYALEMHDGFLVYELFDMRKPRSLISSFLELMGCRWADTNPQKQPLELDMDTIADIYKGFGCGELLERGAIWDYSVNSKIL